MFFPCHKRRAKKGKKSVRERMKCHLIQKLNPLMCVMSHFLYIADGISSEKINWKTLKFFHLVRGLVRDKKKRRKALKMHLTTNNVNSGSGTNANNNNNANNSTTNTTNNGSSNNSSNSNNNNAGSNASGGGNSSNSSNNNSSSTTNNNNSSSNNNQPLTPEQILQETYTKMTSDILAERTLGDFMSEHPGELIRTGSPLFVCTVLPSHWRSVSCCAVSIMFIK